MRTVTLKLSDEARAVLGRSVITPTTLTLPEQLDRKLYVEIDKAIKLAGGKWNRGKACHLFESDPRALLGLAVEEGAIVDTKKTLQQFWTPLGLAARMADMAGIDTTHRVLEPSAGTGNILRAIAEKRPAFVVAVEIDADLVEKIDPFCDFGCMVDFLAIVPHQDSGPFAHPFDRIVMNPPFHGGQDIAHIKHALTFLRPGGRLVAICADGPRQQAELFPMATTWEKLSVGTFRESGTDVRAALLTVQR